MKVIKKKYIINNNKIDTSIVLISDIHYYSEKDIKLLNKVLEKIKKINPNYICISGDIIDKAYIMDEEDLLNWFIKLTYISKVILTIGNHEYYINKKTMTYGVNNDFLLKLQAIDNLYLLDNNNKIINNINFIGIVPDINYYMFNKENLNDFKKLISKIKTKDNYYNIILCHTPINLVNKEIIKKLKADLILCGHMHGGVVPRILRPIFKNNGLVSPNKIFFPKNIYGNILIDNTNIIITSGVRVISEENPFKIFKNLFSSEVVDIKIKVKTVKK